MPKSILDEPRFRNEEAAYAYVEAIVWANGQFCPHCGSMERIGKLKGKSTRIGVYKCYECRKPFTVKVCTIFEKSHVPLHIWLQAMHLMCSSKKGFQRKSVLPHPRRRFQDRVVYWASHPRGHEGQY